jgi:GntR family transcriptional regulator of vanillate catabolism
MILAGALKPGERLSEVAIVDRLGVSRTPVRAALMRLEQEGFLDPLPAGGYAVRAVSESDVFDAIEIRGTLEGLAARLAAERGAPRAGIAAAKTCLDGIDDLLASEAMSGAQFERYIALNGEFHRRLVEMADAPVLAWQIERATAFPFASPNSFVMAQSGLPGAVRLLRSANDQHRSILDAIENREGARADAVTREHSRLARRNLEQVLRRDDSLALLPGAAMLRRGLRTS